MIKKVIQDEINLDIVTYIWQVIFFFNSEDTNVGSISEYDSPKVWKMSFLIKGNLLK